MVKRKVQKGSKAMVCKSPSLERRGGIILWGRGEEEAIRTPPSEEDHIQKDGSEKAKSELKEPEW